jgi:two-component system sensor histidine kinase YesM
MIGRVNELVENKVEQERNLRYAELKALQAQINPHFIYNTLNSIRSVAKLKGDTELAFVTTNLAKILREGSASGSAFCTLRHSLDLARDYFSVESWRWPGRFSLEESIDQELMDAQVPRLIIQPLVENALTHGLENKQGPGRLSIRAARNGGDMLVTISDDGRGITEERLASIRETLARTEEGTADFSVSAESEEPSGLKTIQERGEGSGIGLVNTHRRLCLIYGPGYGIRIVSKENEGTSVEVRMPAEPVEDSECSR